MRICLIGKNLTNFVLANALAKKKLYVDIAYSFNSTINDSHRTIAISNDNYTYLKTIIDNFKISSWPTDKIKIFIEKSKSNELLEFNSDKNNIFNLINHKEIHSFLEKKLKNNKYIKFFKIKKNKERFLFSQNKYCLIINSDSKSLISKKYFYKKIKKNYNSLAYTSIMKHKKIANNTATQIFTKSGPLAFLPLSNHETSIVFSYNGKKKIEDDQIFKIIKKFNFKYKNLKFSKFNKFSLTFLILRNYFYKNILCFGDVIHRVHPLAGQGFNMTIRDIKILSNIIDSKLDLGLELDSSVAETFQKKTKHLNYLYASSIDFIYEFFKIDNKIDNFFSESIVKFLNKKNFFKKYATQFADKGIVI